MRGALLLLVCLLPTPAAAQALENYKPNYADCDYLRQPVTPEMRRRGQVPRQDYTYDDCIAMRDKMYRWRQAVLENKLPQPTGRRGWSTPDGKPPEIR